MARVHISGCDARRRNPSLGEWRIWLRGTRRRAIVLARPEIERSSLRPFPPRGTSGSCWPQRHESGGDRLSREPSDFVSSKASIASSAFHP